MKLFGYPEFDENGVRTLCTYDNEYSHMLMDVRIYRMKAGDKKTFCHEGEEIAAPARVYLRNAPTQPMSAAATRSRLKRWRMTPKC